MNQRPLRLHLKMTKTTLARAKKFYSSLVKYSQEFAPKDKDGQFIIYLEDFDDLPLQYKKIMMATLSEDIQ